MARILAKVVPKMCQTSAVKRTFRSQLVCFNTDVPKDDFYSCIFLSFSIIISCLVAVIMMRFRKFVFHKTMNMPYGDDFVSHRNGDTEHV